MAVDQFIKIGDIKGESQDDKHKEEIDVLSWSWGMSQSGTTHMGSGSGAGKVAVQDISFTKAVDKSTPVLMQACSSGKHYGEAKLIVRKAGESPLEYVTITMTDVIITSISGGGSGGDDTLAENITLNFGAVKYDYQAQKKDGAKDGGPVKFGWDIAANKKM